MSVLRAYRDDGPLARALARVNAGRFIGGPILALAGAAPLALVLSSRSVVDPTVAAAVAWFVLLGGSSGARPMTAPMDWTLPVVLRATEYGAIAALAYRADADLLPWAYALLFAVAIHQYEVVYRLRHLGAEPPRWVGSVAGGWDGRLVVVTVLARTDSLGPVLIVAAVVFAIVFLGESARTWARAGVERKEFS